MLARLARLAFVAAAAVAAAASASSRSQNPPPAVTPPVAGPPVAQPMAASAALGLWQSSFGAVKIEDQGGGGIHGVWTYDRIGQPVTGYFAGALDGNVLRLTWREPAQPQLGEAVLEGEGWLVFDPSGTRFNGQWWTYNRDRKGEWSGWRPDGVAPPPPDDYYDGVYGGSGYGGALYGGALYGGAGYGGRLYGGVPAF